MSNELRGATSIGETCYALVFDKSGNLWNGSIFEVLAPADYDDYVNSLTEVGSTGIYLGDFPIAITSSGTYEYFVKRQQGASPAEDDPICNTGKVDWTGSSAISGGAGSMLGSDWYAYVLRGGFKRTDKETEVYEETTDAIQEMRRRFMFDEAEVEKTTTDSITVLGDYKIDVESDLGLLLGVVIEDGQDATPLIQVSKNIFDDIYPDINVTLDRGYPRHFTVYAGSIQIGPVPDRVSYSYRCAYSSRAGTVTSVTVGVPFTRDYRDVLRDNVLARLYKLMDEFEKSGQLRKSFEEQFLYATRRERINSGVGNFNVKSFGM